MISILFIVCTLLTHTRKWWYKAQMPTYYHKIC